MKDNMKWEQKNVNEPMHASGPKGGPTESGLFKAGLAVVAGLIIAALARGVKKSDDFEDYSKDISEDDFNQDEDKWNGTL